MWRKSIFVLLLLLILLTSLTGCGMELAHGMIRKYEDNVDRFVVLIFFWIVLFP